MCCGVQQKSLAKLAQHLQPQRFEREPPGWHGQGFHLGTDLTKGCEKVRSKRQLHAVLSHCKGFGEVSHIILLWPPCHRRVWRCQNFFRYLNAPTSLASVRIIILG